MGDGARVSRGDRAGFLDGNAPAVFFGEALTEEGGSHSRGDFASCLTGLTVE